MSPGNIEALATKLKDAGAARRLMAQINVG